MRKLVFLLLTTALVTCVPLASADVLFTTFPSDDTFVGTHVQWIGSMAGVFSNREFANMFTVAAAADVSSYRVAVSTYTGDPPGSRTAYLSLWSGLTAPQTAIETNILFNTGNGLSNIVTVASATNPLLQSGENYWLVLSPVQRDIDCFRWYESNIPGITDQTSFRRDGVPWTDGPVTPSAFEVQGRLVQIPEPATLLLLSAGCLILRFKTRW